MDPIKGYIIKIKTMRRKILQLNQNLDTENFDEERYKLLMQELRMGSVQREGGISNIIFLPLLSLNRFTVFTKIMQQVGSLCNDVRLGA